MKSRLWMLGVGVCLAWSAATTAPAATTYYINDIVTNSLDVFTSKAGNDSNSGLAPDQPKLTLGSVLTNTMAPGDIIYIDTGSYGSGNVISNTVNGTAGNPIQFIGSTNGTTFSGGGTILTVRGTYLKFSNIRIAGGGTGLNLDNAKFCEFEYLSLITNASYGVYFNNAMTNQFRRSIFATQGVTLQSATGNERGNAVENSILSSAQNTVLSVSSLVLSNITGCIITGPQAFISQALAPLTGSRCLFWCQTLGQDMEAMADFQRVRTNWTGVTYADPLFFNSAGLDFHVLSPAGFVSNGVWATNAALAYSPAIDFGASSASIGSEPEPHGGRVNIGLYGGTAEASKSRTNAWLFALSFNDGGTLVRTGRLEWVASTNFAPSGKVDLQFSTNNGAGWSNIATGVDATNEFYPWVPTLEQQHAAVLWRVVDTNAGGTAATNARPFSVRVAADAAFSFYVNDDSTNADVYCSAVGNDNNLGSTSNSPKRTLQALLNAYDLEGGDTVYVDTGIIATNVTTTISWFDSGTTGKPVRIVGSPAGSLFKRDNSTQHTLELRGATELQFENLQLTGGNYGFFGNGSTNITLRNVLFATNQYGVYVTGPRHLFEQCVAADNDTRAFFGSSHTNWWRHGVMWGKKAASLIQASANTTLWVSNSILGYATNLFSSGGQPVRGEYNLVWDTGVGGGYSTFSALQNGGIGWSNSLYANPRFINSARGDFHLASPAGCISNGTWITNATLAFSPAIDLGDPAATNWTPEPEPNGGRLNAGLFGGTTQASKSQTNAWLQVLSFVDGGTLDAQVGTSLRWNGGQFEPGATVTIWLSRDNGASWEILTNNVAATNGAIWYQNTSTNDSSTPVALWKVELTADTNVNSVTPTSFQYKNGPYLFYVNDASTNGDVYCSAVGNDANLGLSPAAPKASLVSVITNNLLGAGDRIYVDTGNYTNATVVTLTAADAGTATNPVVIQGSTNRAAGGSVFGRAGVVPTDFSFVFPVSASRAPSNFVLRNLILTNVTYGVVMTNAWNIVLDNIEVRSASSRAFSMEGVTRDVELIHCVAHGGGTGAYLNQASNIFIRHSVFWENNNAVYLGSQVGVSVQNSILASSRSNAVLYSLGSLTGFTSDYNGLYAGPLTRVATNRSSGVSADNLAAAQALSGNDLHSIPGYPHLANPDQWDYHLKTEQTLGRLLSDGTRTSDSVSSPLLDAGDPTNSVALEPAPNGGRVNIGRFGGTAEASIALTTPWIRTVSFGDAGSVSNGTVPLVWIASGFTGETARIDVTVDGGKTWTNVTASVPVTNGVANWTISQPDTPAAAWRIVCLENTNLWARSTNYFAIRSAPLNIFVATPDTNFAVYVTAPGAADNWRATSNAPINSLVTVFDRFDLEPGDSIWVDPGTYEEASALLISLKDSGTSNNPVRITGNPARPYDSVVLMRAIRTFGANGVNLEYASGVQFSSLMISNAWFGLWANYSRNITLDRVRIGYCATNSAFAESSVDLRQSILEQNLYAGIQIMTGAAVRVNSCLFRDSGSMCLGLEGGNVEVKNSILQAPEALGERRCIYYVRGTSARARLVSNYNSIQVGDGANIANYANGQADRFLIDWQISTAFSNDMSSSGYDPLFADAEAMDFHLKSAYGRFDPALGTFVTNASEDTSRLIDLGDPIADRANEPEPNGNRINIGLYGNTVEASKSSEAGTLVPLTMSDGGTVRSNVYLYWTWNDLENNTPVNVEFSADGGMSWSNLATGIYVNQGTNGLLWQTTNSQSTAMGVWRVVTVTNDPPIVGETEKPFAVKNAALAYFVNDASTNGDVYCTAIGSFTNTGTSSNSPLDSLDRLFGRHTIEHGDTVYVDTGIYPRSSPLVINVPAQGSTNYLLIRGSTNDVAGGTILTNSSYGLGDPQPVLTLENSQLLELRDLRLHGGDRGLALREANSNRLVRIRSVGSHGHGFDLDVRSDQNQFIQCAALSFMRTGFYVAKVSGTLPPTNNFWLSGVIAPVPATTAGVAVSTGALVGIHSGRLFISNSVFFANSPGHVIYSVVTNTIAGDYNCYHQEFIGTEFAKLYSTTTLVFGVNVASLADLAEFAAWNRSDSNSFAADPLFADLATGDLHPRSAGGRYSHALGDFVLDDETSPLIDTADPALDWSLETGSTVGSNGRRANLGPYGGTPEASRTPTNTTFVLLTYNEGGVVRGTQPLKWLARGFTTNAGYTVEIRISTNSGADNYPHVLWTNAATSGVYSWNSTLNPSGPTIRWRVQSPHETSWRASSERDLTIHNTNLDYYVNDAFTNGDVYCTAPGAATNSGASRAAPLTTLDEVLAQHNLEAGDRVWIDTGSYALTAALPIGYIDGGSAAEPVTIQGVTNPPGTEFTGRGFKLENAQGLRLKNLLFKNPTAMRDALSIDMTADLTLEDLDILGTWGSGIEIIGSSNVSVRNSSIAWAITNGISSQGSFNTRVESCTIWSNREAQVQSRNSIPNRTPLDGQNLSFVTVSNTALMVTGIRKPIYDVRGNLFANYNNLYHSGGSLVALIDRTNFSREIDSVGIWTVESGQDGMSLSHNARFADIQSGDFHPKSSAGRFDPLTRTFIETDPPAENSPLIDAGHPASDFSLEPTNHGGRINIGRYGNTAQASKTPTNSALTLISFNDGGRASGTNVQVSWNARGEITNGTVSIFYSADGGQTWTNLVSGLLATAGGWTWDTTPNTQSVQAMLRLEGSDGSTAENERFFSVRNEPFYYYINDKNPTNDVYCSNVGNNTNSGLSGLAPMEDLNALLDKYDLESGDVVYIDTGIYRGVDPWRIAQADSAGDLGLPPVVFQGSTSAVHRTVLDRAGGSTGIQVDYAIGALLRNMTISNALSSAASFNDCFNVAAEWITVGAGNNVGFNLSGGEQLRISHCLVFDSSQGVLIRNWNQNTNMVYPVIEHNVFWELFQSAISIDGQHQATVRHNIFSVAPDQYVFSLGTLGRLTSDYNSFWLANGGRVYRQEQRRTVSPVPIIYATVGAWASASSNDLHSYDGDPLLANPDGLDFHLQSRTGRWDVASNNWTNDPVSSPLIDAGDPASTAWTNELEPRGNRVNIGLYGGSEWASKSETNAALHLMSLNRGGVASGQVALNWQASGQATGHTVRIEVSLDDGASWLTVASSVPAALGGVMWNSAGSSPMAQWRVSDLSDTNIVAVSELNFVLHNGPISYYVNDEFPDDDIYCSGTGASTNSGITPDFPKRWLSEIVDTYDLEPGDVVYVDVGRYQTATPTTIGDLDAGWISQDPAQQVTIQGCTNAQAGESLFIISSPAVNGLQLENSYGIRLSSLSVIGASNGVFVTNGYYIAGDWLNLRGCYNGAAVQLCSNVNFSHSALVGNRNAGLWFSGSSLGSLGVESSLFWSNRYGIFLYQGYLSVSNSLLTMGVSNSFGYYVRQDSPFWELQCDYNNFHIPRAGSAVGGFQTGAGSSLRTSVYYSVSAWALATGEEQHSMENDPQMADPGNGDYHLMSTGGRYRPGIGWTNDTVSSLLIDSGNASTAWLLEPEPNGRRINIGLYGGTAEASKTPAFGALPPIFPGPGSRVSGEVQMKWAAIGVATSYTVNLDYSGDNRLNWVPIVGNILAVPSTYPWNSVPYGRSAQAWWRITAVQNDSISTDIGPFVLDNEGTIPYYVNDASTNGDVYCTAPGDDTNNGLTPATPKANLQAILEEYDLAREDVVYVDSGTYDAGAPAITIGSRDSSQSNLYVTIQGSTNPVVPTVFQAPSLLTPEVFSLEYAVNVRLKNLIIRSGTIGVKATMTINCLLDEVRIENSRTTGLYLDRSTGFRLVRSTVWKNILSAQGAAIEMSSSALAVENAVLWGSPVAISMVAGNLTVSNSALEARGSDGRIYLYSASADISTFRGDYNSYSRRDGALIGEQQKLTGNNLYYNDMASWNAVVSSDQHSMTENPLFADTDNGDFHPKSPQGRFQNGVWTNDTLRSPLVDAGYPLSIYTNEPDPNGGYINIGAYGNTTQASLAQTNPPWLQAISYNEGGVISGSVLLYWIHGGMPGDTLVQLDYSMDEVSWHPIASNLTVATREYLWDASSIPLTLALYWRVRSQSDPGLFDVCNQPLAVKTRNFDYYINDAETNGDVYCQGPGRDWSDITNYGTNASFPLKTLTNLLAKYPVGAGDRIYIDTGTYWFTNGAIALLDDRNAGRTNAPLMIFGSTNFAAGGTRFIGNMRTNGFDIRNTRNIELYDLRIAQARNGIALQNAVDIILRGLEVNDSTNGVWASGGGDVEVRNCRLWRNRQYGYTTASQLGRRSILQSTFWGNRQAAVWTDGPLAASNNILVATNSVPLVIESGFGSWSGDFNLYGLPAGAVIGTNSYENTAYAYLKQWQEKGRDSRSVVLDPLFVSAATGDFHLRSRRGYWATNGTWPVATNTSWAIDAGDPLSTAHTNELPPHGGRLNLGAFGGTSQASLTDSSTPELLAISMRDGGVATNPLPLAWFYRGIDPTNKVLIEYSPDAGGSWFQIASDIPIGSSPYLWQIMVEPTPEAQWRILLQGSTNIADTTPVVFTLRPTPLIYYVNNSSTNGDVYTTAIGSITNRGYLASSPLPSIQAVLDRYQLIGGDQIKVDTGEYVLSNTVTISSLNSGNVSNRVGIVGSTNIAAGGSWLQASDNTFPAFLVDINAHDLNLSWFRLTGFTNAVKFAMQAERCSLSDLDIEASEGHGLSISQSRFLQLSRVLIRNGQSHAISSDGSSYSLDGCVLWSNRGSAIVLERGSLGVTNSILEGSGLGNYCYNSPTTATIRADYNNLLIRSGAQLGFYDGVAYEKLPQWVRGTDQDSHSFGVEPLFYNPTNGDYHLQSPYGRFDPAIGTFVTNGAEAMSPLIDMGSPQTAWSNEPGPNGSRRNIGLYGNTTQASKSNTNQWLIAITATSGGLLYGGVNLVWNYGSAVSSNDLVRLEYSYDDGEEYWTPIAETTVGAGEYFWQSDLKKTDGSERWYSSPAGRWRLYLAPPGNTNVVDMTDTYFGLRNSPFKYYLNDTSIVNDVFTTNAPGDDNNWGFLGRPLLHLSVLLDKFDLEPTDEVLIDTGVYLIESTNYLVRWETSDGGTNGQPVYVRGSPHADGSTHIATNTFTDGFFSMNADHMDVRSLQFASDVVTLRGGSLSVSNLWFTNAPLVAAGSDSVFSNLRIDRAGATFAGLNSRMTGLNQRWGETIMSGTNVMLVNSVVYTTNNNATALVANAVNGLVSNCTVVSTLGTAVSKRGFGTVRLINNILWAGGLSDASYVIAWQDGGLISDWNNLLATNNAWIGTRNGKWEKLAYWQEASGQDTNSVSFNPRFANMGAGDFHLNSEVGRWNPNTSSWATDPGFHSPLIDLGDAAVPAPPEPLPNGSRRNMGAYGGTTNASKSRTNFWVTALTQNDGGVLKGTNIVLRWAAGGNYASTKTVTLQYSADGGATWSNIVSGISATSGSYAWNSVSGYDDSFEAYWRVVGVEDPGVSDTADNPFALRNTAQAYYVNDNTTNADIYCSAFGSAGNDGLDPARPKQTLQQILDAYDLEGGDTVYVDAGGYSSATDIRIIWSRSGDTNADVVIRGQTNGAYTVLDRTGFGAALDVKASRIQLGYLTIQAAPRGILLESNLNVSIKGVVVNEAATGIVASAVNGLTVQNSGFWRNQVGVSLANTRTSVLENLTFALSSLAGIRLVGTVADILQNNIYIPATNAYAYAIDGAISLLVNAQMDYNLYDFNQAGSAMYEGATNTLRDWQLTYSNDFRSAFTNHGLVDIEFERDFHPLSMHGRWTPGDVWIFDEDVVSWAVDHGNPDSDFSLEPTNHGDRINIGMYGNTHQASKGSTNVYYEIRTLDEEGFEILQEENGLTWPLIWSAHRLDPAEMVYVQLSINGGSNWTTLATNNAYQEYFIWQANSSFQTEMGLWRVVSTNSAVGGSSSNYFIFRPWELQIYRKPYSVLGLMRFDWRGGVGGYRYRVEYSEDFGVTWKQWPVKYNGPALINRTDFTLSSTENTYTFEDRTSYLCRSRWYRIWEIKE